MQSRAERIIQRRKRLGFATQEDLARAAGVSARTIASLESETERKTSFQMAKLEAVAKALRCEVDWMMHGKTTYPPPAPQHHTLNDTLDTATMSAALDTLRGQTALMIQQIDLLQRQLQNSPPADTSAATERETKTLGQISVAAAMQDLEEEQRSSEESKPLPKVVSQSGTADVPGDRTGPHSSPRRTLPKPAPK